MRYLLDTHVFLWMINQPELLSNKAATLILNPENELFLSKASYWEICIKQSIGKLELKREWQNKIDTEIRENFIKWLEIEKKHCEGLIKLPWNHRDPFDRLLIATANYEEMTIITNDSNIKKYSIKTVW